MRAALEYHGVLVRDPRIDENAIMARAAEGWDGAKIELRVGARQLVLTRQSDPLAALDVVAQLAQVDPLRGGQDDPNVAPGSRDDEGLRNRRRRQFAPFASSAARSVPMCESSS